MISAPRDNALDDFLSSGPVRSFQSHPHFLKSHGCAITSSGCQWSMKGQCRVKRKAPSTLAAALRRLHPELAVPEEAILSGLVLVDGRPVTNPASMVGAGASVVLSGPA